MNSSFFFCSNEKDGLFMSLIFRIYAPGSFVIRSLKSTYRLALIFSLIASDKFVPGRGGVFVEDTHKSYEAMGAELVGLRLALTKEVK